MANLVASDNPFPSILLAEHVDPSTPPSGHWRLFMDTDNTFKKIDDAGTVTSLEVTGFTDPMTTRGDMIVRNASNVTARLGRGSAGQVLTSDGTDLAWAAPAAGVLVAGTVRRTAGDVTTTSTTFVDLTSASITITTGARRVLLTFAASGWNSSAASLVKLDFMVDGTRVGGTVGLINVNAGANAERNLCMTYLTDVLSAASHTFKVQWCVNAGTGTIYASSSAPYAFSAIETPAVA